MFLEQAVLRHLVKEALRRLLADLGRLAEFLGVEHAVLPREEAHAVQHLAMVEDLAAPGLLRRPGLIQPQLGQLFGRGCPPADHPLAAVVGDVLACRQRPGAIPHPEALPAFAGDQLEHVKRADRPDRHGAAAGVGPFGRP